jgi:DNA mismatch repair protein MutL
MTRVNVLPPEVVSKIAAGEVVERPASVIKELIENSLDAGSTSIEIQLKDAGKSLIHIRDNGHGIDQGDLDKIFLRHSTSKIQTAEDLYAIHSLGFRGEALYSIGAVADIILKSKTMTASEGWEIHFRGGKTLHIKPCAFNQTGTNIHIKELFFNTPARKKFLKANATELHQILDVVVPYTILYPERRFLLQHEDKTLIDVASTEHVTDRIASVLNLEEKFLLTAAHSLLDKNISVRMILGDINIKRSRRDMQFIFVNDRPVQSKSISYHLNQIYRLIMPNDSYPFFAVFLTVPPENIDVNIHPTKREIKIKDEAAICTLLRSLAEQAIMTAGQGKQVMEPPSPTMSSIERALSYSHQTEKDDSKPVGDFKDNLFGSRQDYAFPRGQGSSVQESSEYYIPQNTLLTQKGNSIQSKLENAKFVGAFISKYLLFESGQSLLVVDQHAAAERINYELFLRQMEKGQVEVQHLLSPVLLKLNPSEWLAWEELKDKLDAIGFNSNQWDKETVAIHTHPLLIQDTEKAIRELLSGERVAQADHDTIARRACRASVMAGDILNREKAEFQREQLLNCLDPFTCPHGRPTVVEITNSFLDKQFLRT